MNKFRVLRRVLYALPFLTLVSCNMDTPMKLQPNSRITDDTRIVNTIVVKIPILGRTVAVSVIPENAKHVAVEASIYQRNLIATQHSVGRFHHLNMIKESTENARFTLLFPDRNSLNRYAVCRYMPAPGQACTIIVFSSGKMYETTIRFEELNNIDAVWEALSSL